MIPPVLYMRREPTTDAAARDYFRAVGGEPDARRHFDVVAYHDAECTRRAGRWPWYYKSKPDRRHRWRFLNCHRYRVQWLEKGGTA